MKKYQVNIVETYSDYELKILKQLIAEEEIYAEELENPKFTGAIKNIKKRLIG